MNIGLTGGIASGKSTVSAMLIQKGALLVDADQIAREVVEPGSPVLERVADRFGSGVITDQGSLDRKKLGSIVFADSKARKDLEALLHPPIRAVMRSRMEHFEQLYPDKLVVVDVPLLYESGLETMFEAVVLVYVPEEIQRMRLMARDGLTSEQAAQRLAAQMPIEQKKAKANIIINNSGTQEQTRLQVQRFWDERGLS